MFFDNRYRDNGPLTRVGGMPVYLTTILVALMLAGVVFTAFANYATSVALFAFEPEFTWRRLQIWRAVTYVFVDQASFFTIFVLMFFYSFGQNCEESLGRQRYVAFLAVLLAVPLFTGTVMWFMGFGGGIWGSMHLAIGLVIGFATIHPNTEYWNWVPMKFIAFGCLFLAAVGHVSNRDYLGLVATLATAGVSYGYISQMKSGAWDGFSVKALFRKKPKLRVVRAPERESERYEDAPPDATVEEMDMLLDKIARSGIDSLSAKERARLEAARKELIKRGSSPR